jgi:LL-diaminopimelate aminotransferase
VRGRTGDERRPHPLRRRIVLEKADRFHRLSYDPCMEVARIRRRVESRGVRVIDCGRLRSDLPLPAGPERQGAPAAADDRGIRRLIADRVARERGVRLDPETEVLPLLHIPEGFRLLALAFVNPSDVVLVPDPGDPAYRVSALLAGGWPVSIPLPAGRDRLPALDRVEPEAAARARLLFVCYPNLPTGAWASDEFFGRLVSFARQANVLVAHDASLGAASFVEEKPAGLLDRPGGIDVGIEFHSLAPFHDAGGWRPGYAIGNREVLFAVETLAGRLGLQPAAWGGDLLLRVLSVPEEETERARALFRARVRLAAEGLRALEWEVEEPRAGYQLWVPVPHGLHGLSFASFLLRRAGIAALPGGTFGEFGDDHVLLSLALDEASIRVALDRVERLATMGGRVAAWFRRRRNLGS